MGKQRLVSFFCDYCLKEAGGSGSADVAGSSIFFIQSQVSRDLCDEGFSQTPCDLSQYRDVWTNVVECCFACIWGSVSTEDVRYIPTDFTDFFTEVSLRLIIRHSFAHRVWSGSTGTVSAALAGLPAHPTLGRRVWTTTAVGWECECTQGVQKRYPKLYQRLSAHLTVLKRRITLGQIKQKPGNYEETFETKESVWEAV